MGIGGVFYIPQKITCNYYYCRKNPKRKISSKHKINGEVIIRKENQINKRRNKT